MRFNVGEEHYVIGFKLKMEDGTPVKIISFITPQPDYIIDDIIIKKAVVTEHHKVPVNDNDEETSDGFIFDVDGVRGENQYPRASFGQLSDTMNYIVSTFNHHYNMMEKNMDTFKSSNIIVSYQILTSLLETMLYGISMFRERKQYDLATKVEIQYQQVKDCFEKQFPNKKIIVEEMILSGKHTGIFETKIIDACHPLKT